MKTSLLELKSETISILFKVLDELKNKYKNVPDLYKVEIKENYILLTLLAVKIKIDYYKKAKYKRYFSLSIVWYRMRHPFKVSRFRRLILERPKYVALERSDITTIIREHFPEI